MITQQKSIDNKFKFVINKFEYQINIYYVNLNCKKLTNISHFINHIIFIIN